MFFLWLPRLQRAKAASILHQTSQRNGGKEGGQHATAFGATYCSSSSHMVFASRAFRQDSRYQKPLAGYVPPRTGTQIWSSSLYQFICTCSTRDAKYSLLIPPTVRDLVHASASSASVPSSRLQPRSFAPESARRNISARRRSLPALPTLPRSFLQAV